MRSCRMLPLHPSLPVHHALDGGHNVVHLRQRRRLQVGGVGHGHLGARHPLGRSVQVIEALLNSDGHNLCRWGRLEGQAGRGEPNAGLQGC